MRAGPGDGECTYGSVDVLDLLGPEWEKVTRSLSDIFLGCCRQANASWLGERLQARGDVDAIAEQIATLHHDVADMDSDSELKPALPRESDWRR